MTVTLDTTRLTTQNRAAANSTYKKLAVQCLNKASRFVYSRYREDYSIGFTDLLELTERVRIIQDILAESGKTIFRKKMTNQPVN